MTRRERDIVLLLRGGLPQDTSPVWNSHRLGLLCVLLCQIYGHKVDFNLSLGDEQCSRCTADVKMIERGRLLAYASAAVELGGPLPRWLSRRWDAAFDELYPEFTES